MSNDSDLTLTIEKREVPLHYPGAEGITFQDALFVIQNNGTERADEVVLRLKATQGDKNLFDGEVQPSLLELPDGLEAGESLSMSVFRIMQKVAEGFASRVNFFGYKAALNWSYEIVVSGGDESLSKTIRWIPSKEDAALIEVAIL